MTNDYKITFSFSKELFRVKGSAKLDGTHARKFRKVIF